MLMQNLPQSELQHELRTPITAILGIISYLKKEPLTPEQQSYVNVILQSTNRLLNFANTLQPQPCGKANFIAPKKPKVLLVEDDPFIQTIHQTMLSDLGCETDVAANATEALELANRPYDLILLDIGLPDLNGVELAKRLRIHSKHVNTRLIALTAYTDQSTQNSCLNAGIEQVLHKPVEHKTLAALLSTHNNFKEELPS